MIVSKREENVLIKRANLIKDWLNENAVTVKELSEKTNPANKKNNETLTPRTIQRALTGKHDISLQTLKCLAKAMGVPVEVLRRGSKEKALNELVQPVHAPSEDRLFGPLLNGIWEEIDSELGDVIAVSGGEKTAFAMTCSAKWAMNKYSRGEKICLYISTTDTGADLNKKILSAAGGVPFGLVATSEPEEIFDSDEQIAAKKKLKGVLDQLRKTMFMVPFPRTRTYSELITLIHDFANQRPENKIFVVIDNLDHFKDTIDYDELISFPNNVITMVTFESYTIGQGLVRNERKYVTTAIDIQEPTEDGLGGYIAYVHIHKRPHQREVFYYDKDKDVFRFEHLKDFSFREEPYLGRFSWDCDPNSVPF